ncbi:MAG: hypothetical protein Kow0068_01510 [Marinilabiliales bacterium]
MKYFIFCFFILLSGLGFAQENLSNDLSINKECFNIKSKHTFFTDNLLSSLFCKNKYIKIPVAGKLINKNLAIETFSLIIEDSLSNVMQINILSMGNKALGDEQIKTKNKKNENYNSKIKLIKRKEYFVVKFPIRYTISNSVSTSSFGYRLEKGNYFIYIKYHLENKVIRSNRAKLIVK